MSIKLTAQDIGTLKTINYENWVNFNNEEPTNEMTLEAFLRRYGLKDTLTVIFWLSPQIDGIDAERLDLMLRKITNFFVLSNVRSLQPHVSTDEFELIMSYLFAPSESLRERVSEIVNKLDVKLLGQMTLWAATLTLPTVAARTTHNTITRSVDYDEAFYIEYVAKHLQAF